METQERQRKVIFRGQKDREIERGRGGRKTPQIDIHIHIDGNICREREGPERE